MKKIISLLLAVIIMISAFPGNIFAKAEEVEEPQFTIEVDNTAIKAGNSVDVAVSLKNNPGMLGATFTLSYDEGLTLTKYTYNEEEFPSIDVMGPGKLTSPCNFVFDSQELKDEDRDDGTLIVFTFTLAEDVKLGETLNIKLSYVKGDVFDEDFKVVNPVINNGSVTAIDYVPGDLNEDGRINSMDTIYLRRYLAGGYGVTIKEPAADVNADGRLNTMDVIFIRRCLAGGFGTILKPSLNWCEHQLKAYAAKGATCTENGNLAYWQCELCEKYYLDENTVSETTLEGTVVEAKGHNVVIDEAKEPTYTEPGLTEGSHCADCGEVFTEQELIDPLVGYSITYRLNPKNDSYLATQEIVNPNNIYEYNPQSATITLKNIEAPVGYVFLGWYDLPQGSADAKNVKQIAKGSSGDVELFAYWDKVVYRITYDTPDVNVYGNKITGERVTNYTEYTVDIGATLDKAETYGYTFVGWSNDDGFLINSIKPGTTGNITVHANWTSNRNRATSYSSYDAPIIIEDDNKGQFLFVYDIGRIDNVPISPYIDKATNTVIGANGTALNIDMQYEVKEEFTSEQAEEIVENIANATTRSSGWTLSKEWNDLYSEGSEYADKQVKTEERIDSQGNIVGGNYFVSNSEGGSSFVSTESGGSFSNSSKVTTDKSYGINTSYDKSSEMYCDAKLGITNETKVSAGAEFPVKIVDVSVGIENTTTTSAEVSNGRKDNESYHVDTSASSYIGTVDTSNVSAHYNTTTNQSSNWNSTTGYEESYQTSIDTSVRNAVANEISKTTKYNVQKALGSGEENTETVSGTTSSENGYSNSLKFSNLSSTTTTKHVKYQNSDIGYYRVVTAGTVHVYGVVGYNVATQSYFTYTYNVLADDTFEYVDYSKERATFDDCQNGVVTFEIPYEVNEYIAGVVGGTEGIEYGLDGTVNKFATPDPITVEVTKEDGTTETITREFGGTVVVPQYHADTQPSSANIAIKTSALNSKAFKGNTDIETVILPIYITEIPDNAFEGCTNLKRVIAYGVTKIGKYAFKDCTSLEKFYVDNFVTEIGEGAFTNVNEIAVMAESSSIADAAVASGAKRITVDISKIKDTYNNKTVVINNNTTYFAIVGNGGEYTNLQIKSNATEETVISRIKFKGNSDTPLIIDSPTVTLSVVEVKDAPVYALHLSNNNTNLKLYGEINLSTSGESAVISKNVTLSKANNNITSKLNLSGKYLVCGEVVNTSFLNVEPTVITEDEYNTYIKPCVVTFNANGGEAVATTKTVYNGQVYGELPAPQRAHYEFLGWYTEAEGGEVVTADTVVNAEVSQTLYAHWKALTATLNFNANGGSLGSAANTKLVYLGEASGTLPAPTRDHYDFNGWFTAASGGTKVTADTVFTTSEDVNLYAQWTKKATSDWVLASNVPSGAEIVNTEWRYNLKTDIQSSSSSVSGYTQYNSSWVWGEYGSWSSWSKTAVSASDSRQIETKTVTDQAAYTSYRYYIWRTSDGWGYGTDGYYTGSKHGSCTKYDEINLTYQLPVYDSGLGTYGPYNSSMFSHNGDSYWFYAGSDWHAAVTHTEYRYRDRSKVYTYYHTKTESKTSPTAVSAGSNTSGTTTTTISNVQKWVRYIPK